MLVSSLSSQYYLTYCITEHYFISAEIYGLSHQKHMEKWGPNSNYLREKHSMILHSSF